jgi:hypothetical protein
MIYLFFSFVYCMIALVFLNNLLIGWCLLYCLFAVISQFIYVIIDSSYIGT